MGLPVLSAGPVTVRHITQGAGDVNVLGATFVPQPRRGLKGRRGFQTGSYEGVLNDEGSGRLTLPNVAGDDGILHRQRFLILTDPGYHPGDEWIEIEHDNATVFVGTPTDYDLSRSTLTLELVDALWSAPNTQGETAAGFWAHAPRDVFEHYTKGWRSVVADNFDDGVDTAKWDVTTSGGSSVVDAPGSVQVNGNTGIAQLAAKRAYWGGVLLASQRAWRLEATLAPQNALSVTLGLADPDGGSTRISMVLVASSGALLLDTETIGDDGVSDGDFVSRPMSFVLERKVTLAIEVRDRWVLFYLDGALVVSRELDITSNTLTHVVPTIRFSGGVGELFDVLLRRCDPYLMRGTDKGDHRLPGLLPSGGLIGSYHDEADLRVAYPDTDQRLFRRALAPTRQPYARRQDATVNFPTSMPPVWQPAGPPNGEYFSVRWTGAIYLDLAAADVTLRLSQVGNAARLWVGRTMYGEQLLSSWAPGVVPTLTSGSLRTHLGASLTGVDPIRIDYLQGTLDGGIVLERSVGGGAYAVVPASVLSPLGIYGAQVRYDSHAEQLKAVALAYGLQYRCEPRSLESGEFPGSVVPRLRVGRDTDKVLTPDESTDASVKGSAGEVIDTLYADAAGLADPANAAQLTAEAINFAALEPGQRMMILSAYESLADITDPVLLQTRLASMLGLRTTTWQEVSARPRGHKQLHDTFPLTGDIAMFAWEPGDGIRIVDELLNLNDTAARQIIAPTWPFFPDGLGAPSVRFRQRPRAQQDALRALVRGVLLPRRNYQGQLAIKDGTMSNLDGGYSRIALPRDLADVVRCELIVSYKSDASSWTVEDHPATTAIATFATTGLIDLLAYLTARTDSYGGASQQFIVSAAGGTGSAEYSLELVVRI